MKLCAPTRTVVYPLRWLRYETVSLYEGPSLIAGPMRRARKSARLTIVSYAGRLGVLTGRWHAYSTSCERRCAA
jgi:hypothetical protein